MTTWIKSSRCDSGSCVEVARDGSRMVLRNSTDPTGPVARYEADEWDRFVNAIQTGSRVPDTHTTINGGRLIFEPGYRSGMPVRVTAAEWASFRDGVIAGEFAAC